MTHGGYFAFLLVDFIYNSVVFKRRNFLWVYIVGAGYLLLNFTITTSTGNPVYKVMTWRDLNSFIFIGVAGLTMLI